MVSFSPIVPYTFSLFLDPLHEAFGWKREAMGGAFALAAITVALVSPLIGMLLDRFPPRRIILPAILIFAVALASLSRLTISEVSELLAIGRVADADNIAPPRLQCPLALPKQTYSGPSGSSSGRWLSHSLRRPSF